MSPFLSTGQTGVQVTKHPVGVLKVEVTPNAAASGTAYVQVHDSAVVPAEGEVPVKSWPIAESQYKEFKKGELRLAKGCYVCLSSTAATKTLSVGGGDTMDLLEVELWEVEYQAGNTVVGDEDEGNPVVELEVWANGAGPKTLVEVVVQDTANDALSTPCFLFIMADSTDTVGAGTPRTIIPVKVGQRNVINFGPDGLNPQLVVGGVLKSGCLLLLSESASSYSAPTGCAMKAEYK